MSQIPITAETYYPTIGAWKVGRWIGMLMWLLPVRIGRMRLTTVLFALPVAPLAALIYVLQKVIGVRYRLTDETIEEIRGLSVSASESIPLCDIADVTVHVRAGQAFHRAGDVVIIGRDGSTLMTLEGVARPERVRAAILDVSRSRSRIADLATVFSTRPSVDELKAIAAKQAAEEKKAAAAKKASAAE